MWPVVCGSIGSAYVSVMSGTLGVSLAPSPFPYLLYSPPSPSPFQSHCLSSLLPVPSSPPFPLPYLAPPPQVFLLPTHSRPLSGVRRIISGFTSRLKSYSSIIVCIISDISCGEVCECMCVCACACVFKLVFGNRGVPAAALVSLRPKARVGYQNPPIGAALSRVGAAPELPRWRCRERYSRGSRVFLPRLGFLKVERSSRPPSGSGPNAIVLHAPVTILDVSWP